jgi:hypothetical protein
MSKHNNYKFFDQIPYKEQYNTLSDYNSTKCSSYTVQNYSPISYNALTHGGLKPSVGHFNIIDAYGKNASNCDIKTSENFSHH